MDGDEDEVNHLKTILEKLKKIKENQMIIDFFASKFKSLFINQKLHYEQIRSLFISSSQRINISHDNLSDIKNINHTVPGLKLLTDFVFSRPNSNPLIDFFTFSILPSYFKFFCPSKSISQLIDYFFLIRYDPNYTEEQYDLLARIVFVSPNFLHFSSFAFQPFLSHFIDNTKGNGINESEINKIKRPQKYLDFFSNIIRYKYLFPKETFAVLCLSTDMCRTLQNSFFKYSLHSKKASYAYNLFYLAQDPSYELLSLLQSKTDPFIGFFISEIINYNPFLSDLYEDILTKITDFENNKSESLEEMEYRINDTSFYNFPLNIENINYQSNFNEGEPLLIPKPFFSPNQVFDENDISVFPEFFQPLFISSNDLSFFNFFNGKSSFFDTNSFEKITFFFDFNGTLSNYQQTNINENILKLLPCISSFDQVTSKNDMKITSLHQYFDVLLNDKYISSNNKEIIKTCSDNLLQLQPQNLLNLIESSLRLIESSPIRNKFAHSTIFPLLSYLNKITTYQITSVSNVILFYHIDIHKVKLFTLKDYLTHPDQFDALVSGFLNSHKKLGLSEILVSFKMVNEIGLTLKSFSKIRSMILSSYDQKLNDFLSVENNYMKKIDKFFDKKQVQSFLKSYVLSYQHNYFNTRSDGELTDQSIKNISDLIIDTFFENSITRKSHVFSTLVDIIIYEIDRLFTINNSHHISIGPEDVISTMIFIIMRINPPKLVTHLALMNDFYLAFENYNLIIAFKVIFRLFNENDPNPVAEELFFNRKE